MAQFSINHLRERIIAFETWIHSIISLFLIWSELLSFFFVFKCSQKFYLHHLIKNVNTCSTARAKMNWIMWNFIRKNYRNEKLIIISQAIISPDFFNKKKQKQIHNPIRRAHKFSLFTNFERARKSSFKLQWGFSYRQFCRTMVKCCKRTKSKTENFKQTTDQLKSAKKDGKCTKTPSGLKEIAVTMAHTNPWRIKLYNLLH